ncbi:short-chain dehydrogenase [Williamsia sp. Leaf354]|uniref:SDR family oxidoreductase n=1 Tax=Williamsia sp. Leaf354 TaxID=1736349 RepID=UPI0006F801B7|nr:SDR family oxidoreductase [Williamsia sp. Leaf354]KQR98935.1 short-chain dehydrogenase [Williamsia sp. Leaf354]
MTTPNTSTLPSQTLTGRVALVTGAGSGIGAATALALAEAGVRVALVGRRRDRLVDVAEQIAQTVPEAPPATVVVADVTDTQGVTEAVRRARTEMGVPFDLVCANAGSMLAAPIDSADTAEWDTMISTNIAGVLATVRATVDDLTEAGGAGRAADLVVTSSIGAHLVLPGYAVYTATKAAVTHLGTNLRAELGPRGVRVRVVEPGMTESELGDHMSDPDAREWLARFAIENPPMPASAIAESVRWSASLPVGVNVASMIVLPTGQG